MHTLLPKVAKTSRKSLFRQLIHKTQPDPNRTEQFRNILQTQNRYPISCRKPETRQAILSAMFLEAQQNIRILEDTLAPQIFANPETLCSAAIFLKRGGRLQITLLSPPTEEALKPWKSFQNQAGVFHAHDLKTAENLAVNFEFITQQIAQANN
jgi:hypothetical protein